MDISLDIYQAPILIDFAKIIEPSTKIEIEVLPDPISIQATPDSFSSFVKIDKADTYGFAAVSYTHLTLPTKRIV